MDLKNFRLETDPHGIATVYLDIPNQPVNILAPALLEELEQLLAYIETQGAICGVVWTSGKARGFVTGADINVIYRVSSASEASRLSREGQRALARLEALHQAQGKPCVMAIHGAALGGGLELALAGSHRVCTPESVLGLPEVQLGLIPGTGGTQRLPRLVGLRTALDLILTGRNVRSEQALRYGLVDEVVPQPLLLAAARRWVVQGVSKQGRVSQGSLDRFKGLAKRLTQPDFLQHLALDENPLGQRVTFRKSREKLLKKTRGLYPAPQRALDVVRIGIQEGADAGYAAESDRFGQLAVTPEARHLMALFFKTQALKKITYASDPTQIRPVTKLGVVGGGLMGGGIAAVSVMKADLSVRLKEIDAAGVGRGLRYLHQQLTHHVRRKRCSQAQMQRKLHRLTATTSYTGFKTASVMIEAVFEDLDLKRRVFQEMSDACGAQTVLASNTSCIPISKIAQGLPHPERVVGMHYFSPVEKMPLLEVVVTDATAPWVVATCVQLGKDQGKTVIVVKDSPGFYTTRILTPYMNEAAWLLWEGASIEQVDEAAMDFGFPVGPLTLLDELGIDVGVHVARLMEAALGERLKMPAGLERLLEDHRLGRKNARGLYAYHKGHKIHPDEAVYKLWGARPNGKSLSRQEIQDRLVMPMLNEAARCWEEGILKTPQDGDVGAILGLGFPPFLGGPFGYMDTLGASGMVRRLEALRARHGMRFQPAAVLLEQAQLRTRFGKA